MGMGRWSNGRAVGFALGWPQFHGRLARAGADSTLGGGDASQNPRIPGRCGARRPARRRSVRSAGAAHAALVGPGRQVGQTSQARVRRRTRVSRRARAEGNRYPEGGRRAPGGGAFDVFHGRGVLRRTQSARPAAGLQHQVAGHDAAAGQAQSHHARRRAGVGVLLRRQAHDGVCAGREPGRRRGCAADHRWRAQGGL